MKITMNTHSLPFLLDSGRQFTSISQAGDISLPSTHTLSQNERGGGHINPRGVHQRSGFSFPILKHSHTQANLTVTKLLQVSGLSSIAVPP